MCSVACCGLLAEAASELNYRCGADGVHGCSCWQISAGVGSLECCGFGGRGLFQKSVIVTGDDYFWVLTFYVIITGDDISESFAPDFCQLIVLLMLMRQSVGNIHHCAASLVVVRSFDSLEFVRVRPTSRNEIPFEVRPMKESQGECRDIGCPELNFETGTNTTLDLTMT